MARRTISFRPLADEYLASIYKYSFQVFGEDRAIAYIRDLKKIFIMLANKPELARKCDSIKTGLLTYQIASHILFFRITETRLSIIRILHKSM